MLNKEIYTNILIICLIINDPVNDTNPSGHCVIIAILVGVFVAMLWQYVIYIRGNYNERVER